MKVRCIESDYGKYLTFGKEYEVIKEGDKCYCIVDDCDELMSKPTSTWWSKSHFKIVEEEPKWKPTHVLSDESKIAFIPIGNSDPVVIEFNKLRGGEVKMLFEYEEWCLVEGDSSVPYLCKKDGLQALTVKSSGNYNFYKHVDKLRNNN